MSIEDLAEDKARQTLLSSLTLRPVLDARGVETREYEVTAGGRRFRALERLAQEALAAAADAVRTEGWLWVEALLDLPYGRTWGLGRITDEQSPLDAEAAEHLATLNARLAALEAEWAHVDELPDAVDREIGAI